MCIFAYLVSVLGIHVKINKYDLYATLLLLSDYRTYAIELISFANL